MKALWELDKKTIQMYLVAGKPKDASSLPKKKFSLKAAKAAAAKNAEKLRVQWMRWSLRFCGVLFDHALREIEVLNEYLQAYIDQNAGGQQA